MVRDGASRLLTMRPSERGGSASSQHPQPVIPAKAGNQYLLNQNGGSKAHRLSIDFCAESQGKLAECVPPFLPRRRITLR